MRNFELGSYFIRRGENYSDASFLAPRRSIAEEGKIRQAAWDKARRELVGKDKS